MYSLPMAIVDFVPVIFFGMTIFLLQKDLYNKMSKGAYALFCAGTIDVFLAGVLKALYKILYAANICDFERLNAIFFPLQAIGFLMAGGSMLCMMFLNQISNKTLALAPIAFSGTMIFVSLIILGLLGMDISLIIISRMLKKNKIIILFVISFFFSLAMGYLSSKDFTRSYINWIGEIVNIIAQASLYFGVKCLDINGLMDLKIKES